MLELERWLFKNNIDYSLIEDIAEIIDIKNAKREECSIINFPDSDTFDFYYLVNGYEMEAFKDIALEETKERILKFIQGA